MRIDLTGKVFGKLTVVKHNGSDSKGKSLWECKCECGNSCVVRLGSLKRGTKSCGCLVFEPRSNLLDLTGQKFGNLTVIKRIPAKKTTWQCKCNCGNITNVYRGSLLNGDTKSCGCKAGYRKHGMSQTRQFRIWYHVINRCNSPSDDSYELYGGRGIKVCNRWLDFSNFWEDMKEGYSDELSIERKDVNGNYEPDNCKWATAKEQSNNTRRNVKITFNGETKNISQWASEIGLGLNPLKGRIKRGWGIERALTTPVKKYKPRKHA